jgi:chemotaxis protein methyltransferase CheR
MIQSATYKTIQQQGAREFAFSERDFRFLATLVNEATGIVLSDQKQDMVYSRLTNRLRKLGFTNFGEYCTLLQSPKGEPEMADFINALTTNLTSFFRENHHFQHLQNQVLKPLSANPPADNRLRIWSAACSSGMEPYSIAMTLKASIPNLQGWDARILATDIDSNMLAKASAGQYAVSDLEPVPAEFRRFTAPASTIGQTVVSDEIKKLIAFRQLNLLQPWPMKGLFDVIFCRNVVIYFDKPTKVDLFDRIADILRPQGWLYIGHSENLHDISDRFELVGRTIYRKVK